MRNLEILELESTLKKPVDLELSLNDLRIIVGCFKAVAYWAARDGEAYLDPDGLKLKERLESLYGDELSSLSAPDGQPGLCVGY